MQHQRHVFAQPVQRHVAHVVAINRDAARPGVVKARKQRNERGFAGAGGPHNGHRLAGFYPQVDVLERGPTPLGVPKNYVLQHHRAVQHGGRLGVRAFHHRLIRVENGKQALAARADDDGRAHGVRQGIDRPKQRRDVAQKYVQIARRQGALDALPRPEPHQHHGRQARE